jgi:hypothetical protein
MPDDILTALRPDVYRYIDVARLWLRNPLSGSDLAWLRERAGGYKLFVHEGPARFDCNFIQRLTLYQPTDEVLKWLSRRNDAMLNYVEFALDLVFPCDEDRQAAFRAVVSMFVKRHHRNQKVRFVGEQIETATLYTGPRIAPHVAVAYADKPSKVTGEPCVHIEWRAKGAAALRRVGIHNVRDLLNFDHRELWRDRLILCSIDRRKLGRSYNKWRLKSRRQGAWVMRYSNGFEYDMDLRAGSIIARACGSTQDLIDRCGKHFKISHCLTRITDIDHLLPRPP